MLVVKKELVQEKHVLTLSFKVKATSMKWLNWFSPCARHELQSTCQSKWRVTKKGALKTSPWLSKDPLSQQQLSNSLGLHLCNDGTVIRSHSTGPHKYMPNGK